MERIGLLDLAAIKDVLKKEYALSEYKVLRRKLGQDEPVLDSHIKHWVAQELERLGARFPSLTTEQKDWVGHLLERYLVRGYNLCRRAQAESLQGWLIECTGEEDVDPTSNA